MELQRAGHADLVDTPGGETFIVYLCGRPLRNRGRCTLGRETAIQPMVWNDDGWLRTVKGDGVPTTRADAPRDAVPHTFPPGPTRHEFDDPALPIDFQWLRSPWPEELFTLSARPGHLRLIGRETPGSLFRQSLVARRQQSQCYTATTVIEFEPEHYQQMAGLICYYSAAKYHYLYLSHDEAIGKHLRVMSALPDSPQSDAFSSPIAIPSNTRVHLRVDVDFERLYFAYRLDGTSDDDWTYLPQMFDASILSDEATAPGLPNFTGAFVGMACHDMAGAARHADFDFFEYRERDYIARLAQVVRADHD